MLADPVAKPSTAVAPRRRIIDADGDGVEDNVKYTSG